MGVIVVFTEFMRMIKDGRVVGNYQSNKEGVIILIIGEINLFRGSECHFCSS